MSDFDTSDLANLQEFLKSYEVQPVGAGPPPTLMDIAGYPNWENVYSNILRFLLDAGEVHGFGTLFIRAILGTYRCHCPKEWQKDAPDPEGVETTDSVEREVSTDKGRIDILVECADFHLCIENKIWSPLHNDLGEYRQHCKKNNDGQDVLGIVLSPYRIKDQDLQDAHFVSITYDDLVKQVRRRMGSYIAPQNTRYQHLLFDFLEQANRFTNPMSDNQRQFLKSWQENEEKINDIYANCDQMWRKMKRKATSHRTQCLEELTEQEKQVFKDWSWDPRGDKEYGACWRTVFDLKEMSSIDGCRVHLDIEFHPLRISHLLGHRSPSPRSGLDIIASRVNSNCGSAFNYSNHPSEPNKIVMKKSEDSPLEDSVCKDAIETSVAILKAIAAMCLAEQKIQQETS